MRLVYIMLINNNNNNNIIDIIYIGKMSNSNRKCLHLQMIFVKMCYILVFKLQNQYILYFKLLIQQNDGYFPD